MLFPVIEGCEKEFSGRQGAQKLQGKDPARPRFGSPGAKVGKLGNFVSGKFCLAPF